MKEKIEIDAKDLELIKPDSWDDIIEMLFSEKYVMVIGEASWLFFFDYGYSSKDTATVFLNCTNFESMIKRNILINRKVKTLIQ